MRFLEIVNILKMTRSIKAPFEWKTLHIVYLKEKKHDDPNSKQDVLSFTVSNYGKYTHSSILHGIPVMVFHAIRRE